MAKSKLVKVNEEIAKHVTEGFDKMSTNIVSKYNRIEDKFVDRYLTHDGESIEDAKIRLKTEHEASN